MPADLRSVDLVAGSGPPAAYSNSNLPHRRTTRGVTPGFWAWSCFACLEREPVFTQTRATLIGGSCRPQLRVAGARAAAGCSLRSTGALSRAGARWQEPGQLERLISGWARADGLPRAPWTCAPPAGRGPQAGRQAGCLQLQEPLQTGAGPAPTARTTAGCAGARGAWSTMVLSSWCRPPRRPSSCAPAPAA